MRPEMKAGIIMYVVYLIVGVAIAIALTSCTTTRGGAWGGTNRLECVEICKGEVKLASEFECVCKEDKCLDK